MTSPGAFPAFSPSLNRAVLAAFAGLPGGMAGTQAFEWLSSVGLARRMQKRGLDAGLPDIPAEITVQSISGCAPYPLRLNQLVQAHNAAALALADELGIALAALLATLILAPADARAARPDWPDSHWQRWQAVQRVGLGGGVVSGELGRHLLDVAQDWLPQLEAGHISIFRAEEPQFLALRGAASLLPDDPAVLLDGGHTSVKRAWAMVRAGQVAQLSPADSRPTPAHLSGLPLAQFLAATAAELVMPEMRNVGFSLAVYTDERGQPLPGQTWLYGTLGEFPLISTLEGLLRERLGHPVRVQVSHDGTAAARALLGRADAAVMLGTSIGSGLNVR